MSQSGEPPAVTAAYWLDEHMKRTPLHLTTAVVSGRQVADAAGKTPVDDYFVLFREKAEALRELREDDEIALEKVLGREFFVLKGDRLYRFQIQAQECDWAQSHIIGSVLYHIAGIDPEGFSLFLRKDGVETEILPQEEVRLDRGTVEHFSFRRRGIEIFINDKSYREPRETLNGAQLKALGGIASDYQLFLEQPGDDKLIADSASVKLIDGMRFYSLPPATFG